MSPEAQHEAITKEVGYYLIHDDETDSVSLRHPTLTTRYPWHRCGHEQFAWEDAPDWLNDLNAMHEAEKALTIEQVEQYFQNLLRICNPAFCATAAQRAEAFLRTVGKWEGP